MKNWPTVNIQKVKTEKLYEDLFPPLADSEYTSLRESIQEVGIQDPIKVEVGPWGENREDVYIVLAGHHRFKIAKELGMTEIPCSIVETVQEKADALYDNACRRQLTEAKRREMLKEKDKTIDSLVEKGLLPELREMYSKGKINRKLAFRLVNCGVEFQKETLEKLTVEKKIEVTPETVLEEIKTLKTSLKTKEDELAEYKIKLKTKETELSETQTELTGQKTAMKNAEKEMAELKKQLDDKNAVLSVEERKKIVAEIDGLNGVIEQCKAKTKELEESRSYFNHLVDSKAKEIDKLEDKIKSLNTVIRGKEQSIAVYEHRVALVNKKYDKEVLETRHPTFVFAQLLSLEDYAEVLFDHVKQNKWSKTTLNGTKERVEKVKKTLDSLVAEMTANVDDIDAAAIIDQCKAVQEGIAGVIKVEETLVGDLESVAAAREELEQLAKEVKARIKKARTGDEAQREELERLQRELDTIQKGKNKMEKDFPAVIDSFIERAKEIRGKALEKLLKSPNKTQEGATGTYSGEDAGEDGKVVSLFK